MTAADHGWDVVLMVGDDEVVIGRLVGVRPDLGVVNALAQLQLIAQRSGYSIRVKGPCRELQDMLDLVGLADVVLVEPDRLSDEPGGQAEGLE